MKKGGKVECKLREIETLVHEDISGMEMKEEFSRLVRESKNEQELFKRAKKWLLGVPDEYPAKIVISWTHHSGDAIEAGEYYIFKAPRTCFSISLIGAYREKFETVMGEKIRYDVISKCYCTKKIDNSEAKEIAKKMIKVYKNSKFIFLNPERLKKFRLLEKYLDYDGDGNEHRALLFGIHFINFRNSFKVEFADEYKRLVS